MRFMRFARHLLLFAAAVSLYAQALSNRRAPSFSLPDSTLRQHDILDYRGTWLLIDFTETSPAKCKELSVKLEAVKKKYGVKVNVLSIVLAPPETQATVAKLVAETRMTTPVLFDSSQVAIASSACAPRLDSPTSALRAGSTSRGCSGIPRFPKPKVASPILAGGASDSGGLASLLVPPVIAGGLVPTPTVQTSGMTRTAAINCSRSRLV